MRSSEAAWVKSALSQFPDSTIDPVVELGSSTRDFRTVQQPHIEREVHSPLRTRSVQIVTTDLKGGDGIDISGNIYDEAVRAKVKAVGAKCVLCCNIFEHVVDRPSFAAICNDILAPDGILIVTVPHSYPYHLDPIDTMFRPTTAEIQELFPGYELLDKEIVVDTTYGHDLLVEHGWKGLPLFFLKAAAKFVLLRGTWDEWKARNHRFLWLSRPYKTIGVVLQKPAVELGVDRVGDHRMVN